ncbi:Tigger transposable element-derived protein 7 [Portunus trituberculatus]|uniref:Tigger transposable element-derived protein 7 n=1 Tax=Portunus trituberculatus TaxID=210409 RepID=A0A5B7JYL3_PORTR|nr:Tigger transposable element-derived protein 7 [Portunus trituberculatus]
MVVADEEKRNVGQLTLQNLKNYNLRSVMQNISQIWNDVSSSTLANGWNCLLHRTEPLLDFVGFEADHFHHQFVKSGENTTVDDINNWLECEEGDPGQHPQHHLLTPRPDRHRCCQVPCHLTMYHCPAYLNHHALQIHLNPSSMYASYHQQDIDVELKSASEEADK